MAKKEAKMDDECPNCGITGVIEIDKDLSLKSNVTVFKCTNPERNPGQYPFNTLVCGHIYARDQSVKLPGTLVLEAAKTMQDIGGYSGLGEFVRESIRNQIVNSRSEIAENAIASLIHQATQNPDTMRKLLEED